MCQHQDRTTQESPRPSSLVPLPRMPATRRESGSRNPPDSKPERHTSKWSQQNRRLWASHKCIYLYSTVFSKRTEIVYIGWALSSCNNYSEHLVKMKPADTENETSSPVPSEGCYGKVIVYVCVTLPGFGSWLCHLLVCDLGQVIWYPWASVSPSLIQSY